MLLAIEQHDEEEKRQSLASVARTELQSKYQQAFTVQQRSALNASATSHQSTQSEAAASDGVEERETSPVSAHVHKSTTLDEQKAQFVSRVAACETMETAAAGASMNSDQTKEGDLVEALERVRLSETRSGFGGESKDPFHSTARDNHFLRKDKSNKSHYVTILEKTEITSAPMKHKFKPNQ